MKKLALICTIIMLASCVLPIFTSMKVSAAEASPWSTWNLISSNVDGGLLKIPAGSGGGADMAPSVPSEFVIKFSMKVESFGNNSYQGFYLCNGSRRAGIYVYQNYIHDYNGGSVKYITNTSWHDYRLETSGDVLRIYIDNNLVLNGTTQVNNWTPRALFFASSASGNVFIENFSLTTVDGKEFAPPFLVAPLDTEYTPEFTTNWAESLDGWTITDCDELFVNEKGNLEFNIFHKAGNFQVERAPKPPENYDVEFGLQIHDYSSEEIQFKAATAGYNNYQYLSPDRIRTSSEESNPIGGMGIQVDIGYDWHDWKIEVRGEYMTIYMDGGEVARYTMMKNSAQTPLIRFLIQSNTLDHYHMELGNVHYKPYFPEVNLTTPPNNSEYAESSSITFKSEVKEDVEYVDYYLNGLNVGRGYAPNYEYILENAKVGTYRVSAAVGEEKSVEHIINVVKGFKANIKADKTEVTYGDAVNFSIETDILNAGVMPTFVEYYMDGQKIGEAGSAPFTFRTSPLKAGTAEVYAIVKNNNGAEFKTDSMYINVKTDGKQNAVFDREYRLEYDVTADNANVEIADGYFGLKLNHANGKTTVVTKDGTDEFALGKGNYMVDVTSGYAIVYYNGHLAFTALLPKTEVANLIKHNGVENFTLGGTGVKTTVMAEKWAKTPAYNKMVANVPHNYSIEFDKLDASDETITFYDGFYKVELVMKDGKITTTTQDLLAMGKPEFTLNGEVKPGYWRVTVAKGLVQVWCDNVYVDSFAAPTNATPARLNRTMSNPSASTLIAIKNTNDSFIHNENFEGTTELDALDFWLADNESGVTAEVKSGAMKISGAGTYLLNGQSNDVVMKWQANVSDTKDFYVTTRLFKNWYNMKLGYDFAKGTWYLHTWSKYGFYPQDIRTDFEGKALTTDVWHDFELITKEGYVELKCDGETVVKKENVVFPFNGYTGFGLTEGSVLIDNVEYVGRCAVSGAVKSAVISDEVGIAEINDDADGAVYVWQSNTGYRKTTDNGETWSEYVAEKKPYAENRIRLNDGRLLEIRVGDLSKPQEAWVSADDGETWEFMGYTSADDGRRRVLLTGSITQAKNGRVFLGIDYGISEYGTSGMITTWYSDNLKDWYMSETVNNAMETGQNFQESSHVELPDGTIRWHARSGVGFVMYADSKDNGVTFGEWRPSQLIAPLCTYAVERDNEEPNTYWAIMQNDAVTYDYRYTHRPRNRFALVVSYDGMESWEYVATLNETTECPSYDACNHVLRVFGDTVYIQWNNLHTPRRSITYAIDKSKVRSQKRFEEIHPRFNWGISSGSQMDMNCILPKTSGMAVIYGVNTTVDVQSGYDAATIAKVFGAEFVGNGTFKLGDTLVSFSEGSASYTVNSETKTYSENCLKNGYFNIKACAEAFGKALTEAEDSYFVWSNVPLTDIYLKEINN